MCDDVLVLFFLLLSQGGHGNRVARTGGLITDPKMHAADSEEELIE
jgi:hypothetical protein